MTCDLCSREAWTDILVDPYHHGNTFDASVCKKHYKMLGRDDELTDCEDCGGPLAERTEYTVGSGRETVEVYCMDCDQTYLTEAE